MSWKNTSYFSSKILNYGGCFFSPDKELSIRGGFRIGPKACTPCENRLADLKDQWTNFQNFSVPSCPVHIRCYPVWFEGSNQLASPAPFIALISQHWCFVNFKCHQFLFGTQGHGQVVEEMLITQFLRIFGCAAGEDMVKNHVSSSNFRLLWNGSWNHGCLIGFHQPRKTMKHREKINLLENGRKKRGVEP